MLKKAVRFYGRFLVSFSAIGYRARALRWPRLAADFASQTWLVTGATGGIGRAIVEGAVARGAIVHALARSADRLAALARDARGPGRVVPHVVDLSLVADTDRVADELIAAGVRADVLVNNVGLLLDELSVTREGLETSYATNLVTHWTLGEALLAGGALAGDAVVIEMSSGGMYNAPLTLGYMGVKDAAKYSGVYAYAVHKRGQAELVKHWAARHPGRRFYVMHPGWADTDGVRSAMPNFRRRLRRVLRDARQGADTALWLAATRPAGPPDAFWFDRAPRPAHAYPHTLATKHTPDDLATWLANEAARVRGAARRDGATAA